MSSSSSSKVIELSVEETNQLRAKLGLPPLREATASNVVTDDQNQKEVLELSVQDSNTLREKLGLAPLRTAQQQQKVIHAPAANQAEQKAAADHIEQAKLKRQVQAGMARFAESLEQQPLSQTSSAKSWAAQMRQQKQKAVSTSRQKQSKTSPPLPQYDETNLQGMNVAHSVSELQEGATTVLTLADAPLLKDDNDDDSKKLDNDDDDQLLENVHLAESRKRAAGLQEKRKLELGLGRAGGYAGFDDDEFAELGGTQGPSRITRGTAPAEQHRRSRGFVIGAHLQNDDDDEQEESDLFAAVRGKEISLEQSQADVTASDFMTVDEDAALRRKKKKEHKFKKKKKKSRKDKKKGRRRTEQSDDEGEEENHQSHFAANQNGKGLLDELEETARVTRSSSRKRRREPDDDNTAYNKRSQATEGHFENTQSVKIDKRSKYEEIMNKGNKRTHDAFAVKAEPKTADLDEEPDDAFLDAALAKARRLNRLKELAKQPRGADAVAEAVKSAPTESTAAAPGKGTMIFSVDETREFTRALRARTEQAERAEAKIAIKTSEADVDERADTVAVKEEDADETMEEVDLHELAKNVKEDPNEDVGAGLDGTTGATVPIGRGVGNLLSMLRQTGELTRKHAGKEEMRGRAKDKKTYDDYEPLELSEVVHIDQRTATTKDKELAKREVKLEYRDKHGRLLTRKEAFRDLSYQFHGSGSGKRKEEKRLQQIAREQAEARLASRQAAEGGPGTFGALKATQKATGKAFVVHKTQS